MKSERWVAHGRTGRDPCKGTSLLPGLLPARVDGKGPVEYPTDSRSPDRVGSVARLPPERPPSCPETLCNVRARAIGEGE